MWGLVSTLVSIRAGLREKFFGRTITAMLELGSGLASKIRVNVLKKVKVNGQWKFCPAVVEANGRLKDRVRIHGITESHPEGVYYIEWRQSGQRRRQAVANRNEVLEQARLKALAMEAARAGMQSNFSPPPVEPAQPHPVPFPITMEAPKIGNAAELILRGVDAYLQGVINAAVHSRLAALGLPTGTTAELPTSSNLPEPHYQLPKVPFTSATQPAQNPDTPKNGEKLIRDAIESYLKNVEPPQREPKTYEEYRLVLYKFRDTCGKEHLQDIDRDDCRAFMRHLYSIGNEARTVFNRMGIVEQMLKNNGIVGLLKKGDKPKWVGGLREMYQPEDLEALFKACSPDEKVLYMFFLFTGERDKEVRYTTWDDIDFARKSVRVTAKKRLGFKPKDKEEREIPVVSLILTALQEYKTRQTGPNPHNLVFPTSQGRPDKKFENKLKRIARRAKLNCGHCESKHGNRCADGPYCGKWFLHKFRHTFATASLENGVSIRTLQGWLGHSDLESTMIYLKFVQRKDIHEILDRGQMVELAVQSFASQRSSESPQRSA